MRTVGTGETTLGRLVTQRPTNHGLQDGGVKVRQRAQPCVTLNMIISESSAKVTQPVRAVWYAPACRRSSARAMIRRGTRRYGQSTFTPRCSYTDATGYPHPCRPVAPLQPGLAPSQGHPAVNHGGLRASVAGIQGTPSRKVVVGTVCLANFLRYVRLTVELR
jgi:hypothetical protein